MSFIHQYRFSTWRCYEVFPQLGKHVLYMTHSNMIQVCTYCSHKQWICTYINRYHGISSCPSTTYRSTMYSHHIRCYNFLQCTNKKIRRSKRMALKLATGKARQSTSHPVCFPHFLTHYVNKSLTN